MIFVKYHLEPRWAKMHWAWLDMSGASLSLGLHHQDLQCTHQKRGCLWNFLDKAFFCHMGSVIIYYTLIRELQLHVSKGEGGGVSLQFDVRIGVLSLKAWKICYIWVFSQRRVEPLIPQISQEPMNSSSRSCKCLQIVCTSFIFSTDDAVQLHFELRLFPN